MLGESVLGHGLGEIEPGAVEIDAGDQGAR